jgi:hypothetical protein
LQNIELAGISQRVQSAIRSTPATLIDCVEAPNKDAASREAPHRNPSCPVASEAKEIGKICFARLNFGITQTTDKEL